MEMVLGFAGMAVLFFAVGYVVYNDDPSQDYVDGKYQSELFN